MRSTPTNTLIAVGSAVAMLLLVAAVWAADISTPAALATTGLLVLIGVALLAGAVPRGGGERHSFEADADQRDRMQGKVP